MTTSDSLFIGENDLKTVIHREISSGWDNYPTVMTVLKRNKCFVHFVSLIEMLALDESIEKSRGITIFVPEDNILSLQTEKLSKLSLYMVKIIQNHILNGVLSPDMLIASDGVTIKSMGGGGYDIQHQEKYGCQIAMLTWKVEGEEKRAIVLNEGIKCKNGIIYIINNMLI